MRTVLGLIAALASSVSVLANMPEQLFLDLDVNEVLDPKSGAGPVEPWGTLYRNAVLEHRYGDAIFARYNISGDYVNGVYENRTIEEDIAADANGYLSGFPDLYADALAFYAKGSKADSRPDIIAGLRQTRHVPKDATPLAERAADDKTYGVKCSSGNLAVRSDCQSLLSRLDRSGTAFYTAGNRAIARFGSCRLRLGPQHSPASSHRAVYNVANLIDEDCGRTRSCCSGIYVSGYSPANSGHRKICLSSKNSGCS